MICSVCNATLPEESRFCLICGADMSDPSAERRPFDTVADVQRALTGAVAGHYRIGKLLGRGGMGTVFLAEDLTLQREVAIKVLPPRLTSEEKFVSRFMHEARTAAKLDHPNIIPIYAVQSSDNLHYFAMKYVTGRTIEDVLQGGPMPVDECRRVLFDAAMALAHAHQRGVVHRDVKPSNIMIDESGRVLLGDFGISKALESSTQFTGTGQIVGTPHYMSPEQAKGGVKLDGRSDQYSLGVVGFQMLTGQLLFPSGQAHTVIYGHIHEPPPSLRALRPDIPVYLEQALLKSLAKDPAERFATMDEFAAAVAPERRGGSVTARPASRRPAMVGTWAAAAVVVVVSALYLATHRSGVAAPTPVAVPRAASPQSGGPPPSPQPAPPPAPAPSQRPATASRIPAPPPAPSRTPAVTAPAAAVAMGYLSVDAQPYGMLSINGVDVGDTPVVRHAMAPGTYDIMVARDGYKSWSEHITITAGNTERRSHVLEPAS
ncbi:MAG TPA: serine/threonine-protein kinase [Gemmatimonadales bacterium]|jgi:serine/threonine-protein kinase